MKNLLLLVCLLGFSLSFASSELNENLPIQESITVASDQNTMEITTVALDCGLLASTAVQILNNMGFPESGTAVIGNIILGICETIF